MASFIALCFLGLAVPILLVLPSHAQNSPQDYLRSHNVARARFGVPNLRWDNNVAAYAQRYANTRSKDCAMVHSHGPYGENLDFHSGSFTSADAVSMWLGERPYYNYTSNSCCGGHQCLHYTQVLWRYSTRLGCARVRCSNNGWWFITCNYSPPGNYYGKRPY